MSVANTGDLSFAKEAGGYLATQISLRPFGQEGLGGLSVTCFTVTHFTLALQCELEEVA